MSLTPDEQSAIQLTADLTDLVAQNIIGFGPTRDADLAEFVFYIHGIQHTIMSQAAAREHPELYRQLGAVIDHE